MGLLQIGLLKSPVITTWKAKVGAARSSTHKYLCHILHRYRVVIGAVDAPVCHLA